MNEGNNKQKANVHDVGTKKDYMREGRARQLSQRKVATVERGGKAGGESAMEEKASPR